MVGAGVLQGAYDLQSTAPDTIAVANTEVTSPGDRIAFSSSTRSEAARSMHDEDVVVRSPIPRVGRPVDPVVAGKAALPLAAGSAHLVRTSPLHLGQHP